MKERKKRSQKKKKTKFCYCIRVFEKHFSSWVACLWHGILLSVLALERLKIKYISLKKFANG